MKDIKENSLLKLERFGQSIWMDFIRRGTIASGELKQLIEEDGLGGVTSNPSIFEKAIAESHDYDEPFVHLHWKARVLTKSTRPSQWKTFNARSIFFVPSMIGWTGRMGL